MLIRMALQDTFDFGAGPNGDGFEYKFNSEPVGRGSLNDKWNLVSRTILRSCSQNETTWAE